MSRTDKCIIAPVGQDQHGAALLGGHVEHSGDVGQQNAVTCHPPSWVLLMIQLGSCWSAPAHLALHHQLTFIRQVQYMHRPCVILLSDLHHLKTFGAARSRAHLLCHTDVLRLDQFAMSLLPTVASFKIASSDVGKAVDAIADNNVMHSKIFRSR